MMRASLSLLAILLLSVPASATVPWTEEDSDGPRPPSNRVPPPPTHATGSERLADFIQSAWFVASMQVTDEQDLEYGGIREGEGAALGAIVQTDNTSESIWVFSRYWELTQDPAILPYLERSWIYVNNFPAYDEEGGYFPASGYYRTYNCGWALMAGLKYEEVFGDLTHLAYVDSCANYLASRTLSMAGGSFDDRVNPPVLAWAAGNLRNYGVAKADSIWKDKGWRRGRRVKDWIEADPTILSTEEWAMSGGAAMWGVLESYFDEYPEEEDAWVTTYAPFMDTFASPGNWENAWQGWYAWGCKRLEESTGEPAWGDFHEGLTDYLLAFDSTDDDGGIMAKPSDADSLDQAWVTSYLLTFCLDPLLGDAVSVPVLPIGPSGAIALSSPRPNPFRAGGQIAFRAAPGTAVDLELFDLAGRRVVSLARGRRSSGLETIVWDGRNQRGIPVPAGVYFVRLQAGREVETGKLVLVR